MHIQTIKRVFIKGEEEKGPSDEVRKLVILDLLKKHVPKVFTQPSVILEAGCGDIWLIQELSRALPKATFLAVDAEYDEEALLFYKEKFSGTSVNVFDTVEAALEDTSSPVDVVLLADVLGYLQDDSGFLKWLLTYEKLQDANWLINTSAFAYLSREDGCRRYTCKSLERMINKAGLESLDKGYFFSTLYLLGLIYKVFRFKRTKEYSKFIFKVLKGILIADYTLTSIFAWIGLKLPGDNCYMVGKFRKH